MSPSVSPINEDHTKALSVISKIGCIVSMIFLVLSVAIHAFFWRFVKSVRTIVHTNLSIWLIVAYILFLVGFNRTENKDICTAFAVLLHFVFLVVFFGMLTEGCSISFPVLKPLSSRKPGIPLMIASYVIAVIIVVISTGVTQLHGYGSEQACWLSTETGLIWAFLVPVFFVVLVCILYCLLTCKAIKEPLNIPSLQSAIVIFCFESLMLKINTRDSSVNAHFKIEKHDIAYIYIMSQRIIYSCFT
ncbi:latrophilin-like protein LAT-2 [Ruditapes philippinarum]|uniref:latrophilin-like protein LAT-2 n=1 Tax=Ruditapes philippinarum TaxID=129788 RepID=UPI00295A7A76|nr:latrophilin-like protein LAT-2 [Ruditapes philippinarum]